MAKQIESIEKKIIEIEKVSLFNHFQLFLKFTLVMCLSFSFIGCSNSNLLKYEEEYFFENGNQILSIQIRPDRTLNKNGTVPLGKSEIAIKNVGSSNINYKCAVIFSTPLVGSPEIIHNLHIWFFKGYLKENDSTLIKKVDPIFDNEYVSFSTVENLELNAMHTGEWTLPLGYLQRDQKVRLYIEWLNIEKN